MAHVLLIEPDNLLARTYIRAFQHAGHSAIHATTAQAGIDQADTHTPDIIILEIQLPTHNGVEFLYELRSHAEWQTIPVLINSYMSPADLRAVEATLTGELGVRAVYYKPRTSLQLLLRAVSQHVGTIA